MKRFFLITGVLMMTLTAGAFELGKQDGVIFHNRGNLRAALRMSKLLEKVFCKKYTVLVQQNNCLKQNPTQKDIFHNRKT